MLPVPLAANPTAVLSLVQVNVAPEVPENGTDTGSPPHTTTLLGWLTDGNGFTVMVNVWFGPIHPASLGVTVTVPMVCEVTFAAVKLMSPMPLAPSPMAVLLFVQLKSGLPDMEVNMTSTGSPAQTIWFGGSSMVGPGLTVTSTVLVLVQALSSVAVRV